MGNKIFETVSFHIVKPCNMKCKFCYVTFDDMHVKQMSLQNARTIIEKLHAAGVQKITFAGGEPMLYKYLDLCIRYAKELGMTTSIITNGSMIKKEWLVKMKPYLDWIGLSVDSLNENTNHVIGRQSLNNLDYYDLVTAINKLDYRLKINTVVNRYNKDEDMNSFIKFVEPNRWKIFQALRIEGQNDKQFEEIKVTSDQFEAFVNRHGRQESSVVENNEAMTGSYLLIDPQGRLFENSAGSHTYSDSLIENNIDHCLNQISLNRSMFVERGGIYNW